MSRGNSSSRLVTDLRDPGLPARPPKREPVHVHVVMSLWVLIALLVSNIIGLLLRMLDVLT